MTLLARCRTFKGAFCPKLDAENPPLKTGDVVAKSLEVEEEQEKEGGQGEISKRRRFRRGGGFGEEEVRSDLIEFFDGRTPRGWMTR